MNNQVFGIILASGQSSRMRQPKLLLSWQGLPLIEHILRKTAKLPFENIKIVVPDVNDRLKQVISTYNCQPIYNRHPRRGMGYSLALGIASLPETAEAAIILLGDQPTIDPNDVLQIIHAFKKMKLKQQACPKVIIRTRYCSGRIGHPILFSRHFFDELKALDGDIGGKKIIEKNKQFTTWCHTNNIYPNDIDTPEDYERLLIGNE